MKRAEKILKINLCLIKIRFEFGAVLTEGRLYSFKKLLSFSIDFSAIVSCNFVNLNFEIP